jgi:UDP-GlcNAc:undecaprenyl-phosphate GlcNAc-1-phosphate transferase
MQFTIPCIVSFMLTAATTPLVIRFAKACNCLDRPGERRLHDRVTPRWGGIAFFAGVLPFLLIKNNNSVLTPFIIAALLLIGMGMMDDRTSLDWKVKFPVMAAAAAIVIFGGDIRILNIGSYGSLGQADLGILSVPFTFLSIIGITNAINLLDGLNGLAGGVSLLGFLFMGIAALFASNIMLAVICFAYVGALGGFLLFNFPKARIFMGDTGSLFLGFSLAITAIMLTQSPGSSVNAMFPVLVLILPIFDTLRVLFVRLVNRKNPFKADNLHLHYLFVQRNFSPVNVTLLFWSLTVVFGGIALSLTDMISMSYLYVVLYASSFLSLVAVALTRVRQEEEGNLTTQIPLATINANSADFALNGAVNNGFGLKGGLKAVRLIVTLGVLLMAAQAIPEEKTVLKTQQDKINYAIGVNLTGNFKQQGIEIDLVTHGMKYADSGGKLLLNNVEFKKQ